MPQAAISGNAMIRTGVLEGGDAAKIQPVPHHRGHVFQPVHHHERAKRHDRVAQPADGGQPQRRQRQHGMARNVRLDDRAADEPGPGISEISPNNIGACDSPSNASMAATMISSR
jgi:hypothetical protein